MVIRDIIDLRKEILRNWEAICEGNYGVHVLNSSAYRQFVNKIKADTDCAHLLMVGGWDLYNKATEVSKKANHEFIYKGLKETKGPSFNLIACCAGTSTDVEEEADLGTAGETIEEKLDYRQNRNDIGVRALEEANGMEPVIEVIPRLNY